MDEPKEVKLKRVIAEILQVAKVNGLAMNYKLCFPIYNILPPEVKLALKILDKHGMHIKLLLEEEKK